MFSVELFRRGILRLVAQRAALLLGACVLVALTVRPPCVLCRAQGDRVIREFCGHYYLNNNAVFTSSGTIWHEIDYPRLAMLYVCTLLTTTLICLALLPRKGHKRKALGEVRSLDTTAPAVDAAPAFQERGDVTGHRSAVPYQAGTPPRIPDSAKNSLTKVTINTQRGMEGERPLPTLPPRSQKTWPKKLMLTLLVMFVVSGIAPLLKAPITDGVMKHMQSNNTLDCSQHLNGVKLLMRYDEVKSLVPSAVVESSSSLPTLLCTTSYYGRNARISFGFKDNVLIIIVITFLDTGSETSFYATQDILDKEYGLLSAPLSSGTFMLTSLRRDGQFTLTHTLARISGLTREQLAFTKEI